MVDGGLVAVLLIGLALGAAALYWWWVANDRDVELRARGAKMARAYDTSLNVGGAGGRDDDDGDDVELHSSSFYLGGEYYSSSMPSGTYHVRGSTARSLRGHSRGGSGVLNSVFSFSTASNGGGSGARKALRQPLLPAGAATAAPTNPTTVSAPVPRARAFSYPELRAATGNFAARMCLAEGSSGAVFRGALPGGLAVAIKVLKPAAQLEAASSASADYLGAATFRKELKVLSEHRHINIITLLGHCLSDSPHEPQCLVLELMAGGSLEERLEAGRAGKKGRRELAQSGRGKEQLAVLTGQQRFNIASDVARGLHYLHVKADPPIIHQDIKSANVLLSMHGDGRLLAKVGDFGTARYTEPGREVARQTAHTHHATQNVVGTMSYMAPEYVMAGHVSEKTDAFAFGVVLCELLTAKPPADFELGLTLSTAMLEPLADTEIAHALPLLLDSAGGKQGWPAVGKALQLGRLARRCIEIHPRTRCTVASLLPHLDALAGRTLPICVLCGEVLPPHDTNTFCTYCGHQQR